MVLEINIYIKIKNGVKMAAYKTLVIIVCIITILVSVCGCTSSNKNTTNNITNNTTNSSINNTTTTYISAVKAKELAEPYTGKGVGKGTLGKPVFTTFNGVKVWKFPVNNGYYTIYINAVTIFFIISSIGKIFVVPFHIISLFNLLLLFKKLDVLIFSLSNK